MNGKRKRKKEGKRKRGKGIVRASVCAHLFVYMCVFAHVA